MAAEEVRFRQAMGHFASGVTVVTTMYDGTPYGMTVSAFSSLSLRPQLVLVCIDTRVSCHDIIPLAGHFVVNVLAAEQEHLSRKFASSDSDKFAGVAWEPGVAGGPVLHGALASIECRLHAALPGGDHSIYVGEVQEIHLTEGMPLLYYRGGYHSIS
ncbi:flavin reductase family protein [Chloroflexia bacterium SDU3-3]|nr:flavin reductase family protein [Chloroflexia bacterium SDU3-3]